MAVFLLGTLVLGYSAGAEINRLTLGATFSTDRSQLTFRVYSSRATRVELYLYQRPQDADEVAHMPLQKDESTAVWMITVPVSELQNTFGLTTIYYGYRTWGPNWPFEPNWTKGSAAGFVRDVDDQGNRFNPNKLLLDPYAQEISHDPLTPRQTDGLVYASGPLHRNTDTGRVAPKGIVLVPDNRSFGRKPVRPLKDDIIYEVHVRGLTKNDPSIPEALRGTYLGAARKAKYLKKLGVTAVEFLPVQETQNDTNDIDPNSAEGDNYWGYSTLNYFAPDRRYASDRAPGRPTREFKRMVKAFHDAGIKVFLDVVYNHTGEGYAHKPDDTSTYNILSWRGLDNPTYYSLTVDKQFSWDNTGVGGNYNTFNPVAQDLIVDSLAWWSDTLGVDGFRFDLASVLGNRCEHGCFIYDKLHPGTALNRIARELKPRPTEGGAGVDLIAEPWAPLGEGTYQMGEFPAGWSEWNDKFRDAIRKSQNKLDIEPVTVGELANRFAGSADLFRDDGRRPWNSINFIMAHDGFTLRDLYAFNAKNNSQPYPFGPSDGGTDNNLSWDQGGNAGEQRKAARNGLALLMLSAGTPMLTGGDEFLRTLNGNNNPYNLDSIANWLNYDWNSHQKTFHVFAGRLTEFRRKHPALRTADFYTTTQLQWFKPDGSTADAPYFDNPDNHAIAWRIDGTAFGDPASALYIAYNGWSGEVRFRLPSPGASKRWHRVIDTSPWNEGPDTIVKPGNETPIGGEGTEYRLGGRALLLLVAK